MIAINKNKAGSGYVICMCLYAMVCLKFMPLAECGRTYSF